MPASAAASWLRKATTGAASGCGQRRSNHAPRNLLCGSVDTQRVWCSYIGTSTGPPHPLKHCSTLLTTHTKQHVFLWHQTLEFYTCYLRHSERQSHSTEYGTHQKSASCCVHVHTCAGRITTRALQSCVYTCMCAIIHVYIYHAGVLLIWLSLKLISTQIEA